MFKILFTTNLKYSFNYLTLANLLVNCSQIIIELYQISVSMERFIC